MKYSIDMVKFASKFGYSSQRDTGKFFSTGFERNQNREKSFGKIVFYCLKYRLLVGEWKYNCRYKCTSIVP
jgi:hypothetical protein